MNAMVLIIGVVAGAVIFCLSLCASAKSADEMDHEMFMRWLHEKEGERS